MPELHLDVDEWERHLSAPVRNRSVIVAFEPLAATTGTVERLERWGAAKPLVVAEGRGVGVVPGPEEAAIFTVDDGAFDSVTEQVRARMRPEEQLSPQLVAAVDAYDPQRRAMWWMSPVGPNTPLLGRGVLGGRPAEQALLEEKLLLDDLLEAIDVSRAPAAAVTSASYDELMAATEQVMAASGTDHLVWAGDAREGTNGGGDYVRWIRTTDQARAAADFFRDHCGKVRVSAFLEGVPCSIHGICLPDGVVVLRPVELATLRDPERGRFVAAGMGTSWDPGPGDTSDMRVVARALGEHLRRSTGYRGAFGIDGVITADGFRVTEVNARFSAGITALHRAAPRAHLELIQLNALIGRDVAKSAVEIEERTLALLDDHRFVAVRSLSARRTLHEPAEVAVGAGDGRLERTDGEVYAGWATRGDEGAGLDVIGHISAGPSPLGVFLRLVLADGVVAVGDRVAPYGVLLLDFADRTWDTGFGRLLMPPDVRSTPPSGDGPHG